LLYYLEKLFQTELSNKEETLSVTIRRYEENESTPSIDIAAKIADTLDVSLDYLTGKDVVCIDKDTSIRIL